MFTCLSNQEKVSLLIHKKVAKAKASLFSHKDEKYIRKQ